VVEMIIPFNAGGGTDLGGRAVGDAMVAEGLLPEGIRYNNRPGGSGLVGMNTMVTDRRGSSDTILWISPNVVITPLLEDSDVTYRDLTPIARVFDEFLIMVVRADSEFEDIESLLEAFKNDASQIPFGGPSRGSVHNAAAGMLGEALGVGAAGLGYQPYDGDPVAELLSGELKAVLGGPEFVDLIEAGEVRALATMSDERLDVLPDVPTFKEVGVDITMSSWRLVFGPPDMPEEAVQFYRDALEHVVDSSDFRATMGQFGWIPAFHGEGVDQWLGEQEQAFRTALIGMGVIEE
jgi:putative tricarboxylic transport membrane protein